MPKAPTSYSRARQRGFFISFEGMDGVGKSTQIRLLERRLRAEGWRVMRLREPGGTRIGEKIRHLLQYDRSGRKMSPVAETLLFCASRAQLVSEKIRPALSKGWVVLADRFIDSTTVYQGHGRGLDIAALQTIHEFSVGDCRPDMTFVLMMNSTTALSRARSQSARYDRMERQKKQFYRAIVQGYRTLSRTEVRRVHLIPAGSSKSAIQEVIWRKLSSRLRRRPTR